MASRRKISLPQKVSADPVRGEVELIVNREHFRRVIEEGVCKAAVSLDIMTADFKAMLIPSRSGGGRGGRGSAKSIVEVLRTQAEKGLEIRLLHAGTPSGPALQELKKGIPNNLTIRRCPRLHAKAVVVDLQWMYLGSANLTGAGLGAKGEQKRNFEMGIWTCSTTLIESTMEHFNALWEGIHCKTCQRRDVCPVPLEEPRL